MEPIGFATNEDNAKRHGIPQIAEKERYEKDIGKWRVYSMTSDNSAAGKVVEVKDGVIYLCPYIGLDIDNQGVQIKRIYNVDFDKIASEHVVKSTPSSEEYLKKNCELFNRVQRLKQEALEDESQLELKFE